MTGKAAPLSSWHAQRSAAGDGTRVFNREWRAHGEPTATEEALTALRVAPQLAEDAGGVRAVARAAAILLDIRQHPADGVSAIARRLDLHKSTTSRILAQLIASGLVVDEDGTYLLGSALAVAPVIYRDGPTVFVAGKAGKPRMAQRRPEPPRRQWHPPTSDWTPLCMSANELADWQGSNDRTPDCGGLRAVSPCTDCTLGYAAEMRELDKCNGVPGGVEEDDEPAPSPAMEVVRMSTSVRTIVTAPCGSCMHEVVCSRRASIADLDAADVEIETLAPGLSVALSATVECDAYLRAKGSNTHAKAAHAAGEPAGAADETESTPKRAAGYWTPERRAAQAELMRGKGNLAAFNAARHEPGTAEAVD